MVDFLVFNIYILPAIVPAHAPHSDGMDGLVVEQAEIMGVNQTETHTVQVHVQILAL